MKKNYQVWPIGKLPKELQRPELDQLKEAGYDWNDPRDAVTMFEEKVAAYAGSKYAVAVDNCTDAVMLCLEYYKRMEWIYVDYPLMFPSRCYPSIPMIAKICGFKIEFDDYEWSGIYHLHPLKIIDGATRFTKDMYVRESYQCLSFQIKKRLPIGKGGMILTDNEDAVKWFRMASFEGRDLSVDQWSDNYTIMGWNMYMTPEDAARGILIMDQLPEVNEDTQNFEMYPDLSMQEIFK